MNVVLVNPACSEIYGPGAKSEGITLPIGIAYIASYLRKNGIKVSAVDAEAEKLDLKGFENRIRELKPEVVGIGVTTPTLYLSLRHANAVKNVDPSIKVVFGGPHPTVVPEECLRSEVDYVVRGEGEFTMLELVESIEKGKSLKGVKGVSYKSRGKIVNNAARELIENLNELPFPARELFPLDNYISPTTKALVLGKGFGGEYTEMISSRGCPYNCTYCSSFVTFGHRIRFRSPKNFVDEIEEVVEKHKIRSFNFLDDTFTVDKKRVEEICSEIKKRKLDIRWLCQSRVNLFWEDIASKMKSAGCVLMAFGVESGNQQILNNIKKGITLEQAERAVGICKKVKLSTLCSFMVGNPGESRETAMQTIRFALKLNPTFANFFITTPYPGTELYNYAKEKGLLDVEDWSKYIVIPSEAPVVQLSDLTKEELVHFNKLAYKKFYMRPSYIMQRAIELRSLEALRQGIRGFKTLLNLKK